VVTIRRIQGHRIPKINRPKADSYSIYGVQQRLNFAYPKKRWKTVRDAIAGLPDPQSESSLMFPNHEYRAGAKPYAGHSGSVLDEPSKTIKAGAHGVPGGENMVALDNGTLRYYTVRESARIQTFPDEYHFHSSWPESMRRIGNAVPVRLAAITGNCIKEQLERTNVKKRQR
jgi:DNA (cytosine-5)-methyltransferase 1